MSIRQFVLVTHRWLGLASAAVLIIAGGTGAIIVWREILPGLETIGRVSGPVHENLKLGSPGRWVVVGCTGIAVLLELGGLILWWKRRTLRVRLHRGWQVASFDLHHLIGLVCLPLMFWLALTGFVMAFTTGEWRQFLQPLHTGARMSLALKVLYTIATLGFVVQGLTGVAMWWKPNRLRYDRYDGYDR